MAPTVRVLPSIQRGGEHTHGSLPWRYYKKPCVPDVGIDVAMRLITLERASSIHGGQGRARRTAPMVLLWLVKRQGERESPSPTNVGPIVGSFIKSITGAIVEIGKMTH